jgi:hypothetical protein
MFSFRRDKMGFFSGIALMVIVGATVISTLVLLILGLAEGNWQAYLLPVKWILGVAWVLCIGTVMARVHVFGWQLRRAQRQAEANAPAESEPGAEEAGEGQAGGEGPGVTADQSDQRHRRSGDQP